MGRGMWGAKLTWAEAKRGGWGHVDLCHAGVGLNAKVDTERCWVGNSSRPLRLSPASPIFPSLHLPMSLLPLPQCEPANTLLPPPPSSFLTTCLLPSSISCSSQHLLNPTCPSSLQFTGMRKLLQTGCTMQRSAKPS